MGAKITIDSSTLMNKGLEVIEAHHLFAMPYDRISVVVQPQSAIHSMVEFTDGSVKAHLGTTDMRIPIQFALSYPERWDAPVEPLDFTKLGSLEFAAPDTDTFRCLALARHAGATGGTLPCVMNAANEVAVAAFLADGIGYLDIAALRRGRRWTPTSATACSGWRAWTSSRRSTAGRAVSPKSGRGGTCASDALAEERARRVGHRTMRTGCRVVRARRSRQSRSAVPGKSPS